jgi:cytochrome c553
VGKSGRDWLVGSSTDPSKAGAMGSLKNTASSWDESRSYVRWESPVLGINFRGKVAPFIPGCQVFLTQMDDEKNRLHNKVYTTVDGTSGLSHNAIQPHTISKKARSCADCHMNPKALGLGTGQYDVKANFPDGAPIDFELERIVDENGRQIQSTSHKGSRPFNKEELGRISRVGSCVACHAEDGVKLARKAPTDDLHKKAIRKLLKK